MGDMIDRAAVLAASQRGIDNARKKVAEAQRGSDDRKTWGAILSHLGITHDAIAALPPAPDAPAWKTNVAFCASLRNVPENAFKHAPAPDAVEALVKAADQSFFELVVDGMAEADRAMRRFPQPNYVISKVAEEAGEVVKAAIHCAEGRETAANVQGEMKQLIAMLYRLWVEGDQVHGLAAIRAGGKP